MKIKMHEIAVKDIFDGYYDDEENGVTAYGGRLNVRPAFQREFVYNNEQRNEVIKTVRNGFPLNVMYWSVSGINDQGEITYELMDGQQRTLSLCRYIDGDFTLENRGFYNLTAEEKEAIENYKLTIYICEGTEKEKLDWFEVINISGEPLKKQEMRNAIYTGPWLADAKRKFSKNACVAYKYGQHYMNGELNRQAYLETALSWICDREKIEIEEYMAQHQHDADAEELWQYFFNVIKWVNTVFPTPSSETPNRYMKGINWGKLYNQYAAIFRTSLAAEVKKLMADEDVQKKAGIYEYLLSKDEKHLNIRAFTENQKQTAYEKQNHKCVKCGKTFPFEQMEGDHIKPWCEGGKTTDDNCQMLCKECNRRKGAN